MSITVQAKPPVITTVEKTEVDLSPADTWQLIGDFGAIEDWHPGVASTRIVEGVNNRSGAVRKLTLMDGDFINEELVAWHPDQLNLQYRIIDGDFPASDYVSTLAVIPADVPTRSTVIWSATYSRLDASENPADGQDDQSAIHAVRAVYMSGLEAIVRKAAELKAIRTVIGFYAEGGTEGNAAKVGLAFHPSASMKFVRDGVLVDEPIEAFLKNYILDGVKLNRTVTIDRIDIRGTAASARLTLDYPTHQFIDYFNLLKIDGQWLIVSKIFSRFAK